MLTESIPVSLIDNDESRMDIESDLDAIVQSFSQNGQFFPIRIRHNPANRERYVVVFGNRRLAAAKRLGWETIEAKVVETSEEDALIMAFSENADRRDLTDYERALFLERFHSVTGKSYTEIANLLHKSPAFVSYHVSMLRLFPKEIAPASERVKVLLNLTEKHARALSKIAEALDRWNTAKLVVGGELSVRETERLCRQASEMEEEEGKVARIRYQPRDVERLIQRIFSSLSSKDLRPYFEALSTRHFSMYSLLPPFYKSNAEFAKDCICSSLGAMERFAAKITDFDARIKGETSYVTANVHCKVGLQGNPIRFKSHATIILEREESWKIVHEHWSSTDSSLSPLVERLLTQNN